MALYESQTSIKMSHAELKAWRAAAERNGMGLQTWMRLVLDHAAGVGELFGQLQEGRQAQVLERAADMRRKREADSASGA